MPHTKHIATAVQRKTRRSVAFHSPRKFSPTMKPMVGMINCGEPSCFSSQAAPKIAVTSTATDRRYASISRTPAWIRGTATMICWCY